VSGVVEQDARLVVMANQIANNVPPVGDVSEQVAEHLRKFWTDAMRADLERITEQSSDQLREEVIAAVALLA
jgi:hypothetical protein